MGYSEEQYGEELWDSPAIGGGGMPIANKWHFGAELLEEDWV